MTKEQVQEQLLEAVDILLEKRVSALEFDQTKVCTIISCIDEAFGIYRVKYQDSKFEASALNKDIKYRKSTEVYVEFPSNNMNERGIIKGAVDKLGADYINVIEGDAIFDAVGKNILGEYETSISSNSELIIYDVDTGENLDLVDVVAANEYLKQSNYMIAGGEFKTDIDVQYRGYGNYGLIFELEFLDEALGEPINKVFVIDVDTMLGQPYNFNTFTRQVNRFEINGAQFTRIKKITFFAQDFGTNSAVISLRKVELSGATKLDETALEGYNLSIYTPQGTFFPENDNILTELELIPQLRVNGILTDSSLHKCYYYWFMEHGGVTTSHPDFNKYGGQGWKCLNSFNLIGEGDRREWIGLTDGRRIIKKEDTLAFETKYKCVCAYSDTIVLEQEIIIKNYDADYTITIESSNGEHFSFDSGSTSLKCQVVDKNKKLSYNYYWSRKNYLGTYEYLPETIEENQIYLEASQLKNEIESNLASENYYKEQRATIPDTYSNFKTYIEKVIGKTYTWDVLYNSVESYLLDKTITRVEKNCYHNVLAKTITNFTTYTCTVYTIDDLFVGSASIVLTNTLGKKTGYSIVLHNGSQVFKYDESGLSPMYLEHGEKKQALSLSFTLYDENGKELDLAVVHKTTWTVPTENTLIIPNVVDYTSDTFDFGIADIYNASKQNNTVYLEVDYKGNILHAHTNFAFLKEGDPGTNGTNFLCRVVPNVEASASAPINPKLTVQGNSTSLNFTSLNENKWFKVELWDLDTLIDTSQYTVKWEILKNKYNSKLEDFTYLNVSGDSFSYKGGSKGEVSANIIKATVTYQNKNYVGTLPLIIEHRANANYNLSLVDNTGFRFATYSSDGIHPKYDSSYPFTMKLLEKNDGTWVDISTSDRVTYTYQAKASIKNSNVDLLTLVKDDKLSKNQKWARPKAIYDGQCVNIALEVVAKVGNAEVSRVQIPIHFLLNRYGLAALNDWDGNSIEIKEGEGTILSPQIGAGKKNSDNSFTGIVMGTVDDSSDSTKQTGLLGYHKGQRSIFLDAATGKAEFGVQGASRIILDPSSNKAQIYSGNYSTSAKTGMMIDLSTPEIRFGSGKFVVDKDGKLTATDISVTGDITGSTITGGSIKIGNNFNVDTSGNLTAKNANITGTIFASAGDIGGITINTTGLYSSNYGLWKSGIHSHAGSSIIMHAGAGNDNIGGAPFRLYQSGHLVASSAEVSGNITATSGTIGGCSISNGILQIPAANITGTLQASQINTDNLTVKAANITGTLQASQINVGSLTVKDMNLDGLKLSGNQINSTTIKVLTDVSISAAKTLTSSAGVPSLTATVVTSVGTDGSASYATLLYVYNIKYKKTYSTLTLLASTTPVEGSEIQATSSTGAKG